MKKFENFINKSDLVFFSDKGESMSDAQSMKGKCTQISEDIKSHIDALGSVTEVVTYDGKDIELLSPLKTPASDIKNIIGKDAEANTLNAWYANAINVKNILMGTIKEANWTLFLVNKEEHTPEQYDVKFKLEAPGLEVAEECDVLALWTANDKVDFMLKEQKCSSLGKLIHKKGKLHEIYLTPLNNRSKFLDLKLGDGVKSYPVIIKPTYTGKDLTDVKALYLEVHDEHRELEKKVNWYKAKIKNTLTDLNTEYQKVYTGKLDEYQKAKALHQDASSKHINAARDANNKLKSKCEERRQILIKEASALKIFIPENLRPIKKFVESYTIL
jgi:hypothetical protein